jgi:Na+/H+-translocating membrane pyrophosphatase
MFDHHEGAIRRDLDDLGRRRPDNAAVNPMIKITNIVALLLAVLAH